ncbi:unnamed protein product [Vicia faba]|uniref:Uncharacterized protein n=1 Tax=Vicia faba TaxID=3906 RepID=A0AAV0ZVV0_VICFA|nr:unnamed protein product [Vicia faba]
MRITDSSENPPPVTRSEILEGKVKDHLWRRIPYLRPTEYERSRLSRNLRIVNRAYGGVLSGRAVRERMIRAFLVEEKNFEESFEDTKDKRNLATHKPRESFSFEPNNFINKIVPSCILKLISSFFYRPINLHVHVFLPLLLEFPLSHR